MIEIKGVSKRFGETQALKDIHLHLEEGKIYALLGRNGAGKSTLMNIITNRMFADQGEITVDGMQNMENLQAQRKIYLMSEKNYYPPIMRVKEIFAWTAEFYPEFDTGYAMKLAELFGLNVEKTIRGLSTGYASIMKCILALAVNTPYVFLDEPVLGLDANHREMFYRLLLEKYSESPFCCVISTHLIEEISGMIEDVIMIRRGEVVCSENREQLLSEVCMLSGPAEAVDHSLAGVTVLGEEVLGGLKTVCVQGCPEEMAPGVDVSAVDLQKLFVMMTND